MKTKYTYWYTYPLPFASDKAEFAYWKTKSSDEALGLAVNLYKTCQFYIGETCKESYLKSENKGN